MTRYSLHGLEVESEIEIAANAGRPTVPADVTVRLARGVPPSADGVPEAASTSGYCIWRATDGFLVRFPRVGVFVVRPTEIVAYPGDSSHLELISIIVGGNILALCLLARHELVLHAAAVCLDKTAIAIVGSAGMGKSTLAGLLCATGAELVTDDVLRVAPAESPTACFAGSPELRLRPQARTISALLAAWPSRQSVDGRLVLRSPSATAGKLPLASVFIPQCTEEVGVEVDAVRLSGAQALIELLRHPRVLGWKDSAVLALLTRDVATLVRAVPVFRLRFRPGLPFDLGTGAELRRLLCFQ